MQFLTLTQIDKEYGIVVEQSVTRRFVDYDEETFMEEEVEDIDIHVSYKKDGKKLRGALPLADFVKLYKDAKQMIKLGKKYAHTSCGGTHECEGTREHASECKKHDKFDVLSYVKEIVKEEAEKTGPMFG